MKTSFENEIFIEGFQGKNIFLHIWEEVKHPKAIIQIFHGMGEHGQRYNDFAIFLNKQGFIVYANDHRGHGKTEKSLNDLGYIGEDGFNAIVKDEYIITKYIKAKHPGLPIIVFGHSFGSFVAQEYLTRYSFEIHAMILSGSAFQKGFFIQFGALIASLEHHFKNERDEDKLATYLAFSSYNNKFKDSDSSFRWLSSDKEQVKKFEEDPYRGAIFPVNFYYYFLQGLKALYKKEKIVQIRKDIPLLIVSGDMDPVGSYGKSVKRLYGFYTRLNLTHVTLKLFPEKRHELINEINNKEIYLWLLNWLYEALK